MNDRGGKTRQDARAQLAPGTGRGSTSSPWTRQSAPDFEVRRSSLAVQSVLESPTGETRCAPWQPEPVGRRRQRREEKPPSLLSAAFFSPSADSNLNGTVRGRAAETRTLDYTRFFVRGVSFFFCVDKKLKETELDLDLGTRGSMVSSMSERLLKLAPAGSFDVLFSLL
ncbi:hypothetical protein Q5P01_017387 [Channa striata]|uniref:Uncharacterized protein n=1 Tax=Channa striata TaxID=64152 RepID=A0AA88SJ02_CHASR|nr:hypothetical protein Q5P01_017387 [Channa striata]